MDKNKNHSKAYLVFTIIQISILIVNVYLTFENVRIRSEMLQLQISSKRGDLSIFVDWYEYSMTTENINLTVYGHVHNEGARATVVKNVRIGIKYVLESEVEIQFAHTWSGAFASLFGWENLILMEDQMKTFNLTEDYSLTNYQTLINKKPYEGWITISYDDGIGIQNQTKTFSLKYFP